MALTVTYDARAVQEMLKALPAELRDKASAMAVNKTADKAKTEMKRQITAVYNLKSAEVGGALHTTRASAAKNIMSASLYPTTLSGSRKGRAMNVIHFLEKSTTLSTARKRASSNTLYGIGSGGQLLSILYFKFKKKSASKQIAKEGDKSAPFIGNQGRTVFRRTGKSRTPIESVQVIDVPQMFNTAALNQSVLNKAAADLLIETQRAVDQVLRSMPT
jgi:hypothetical protein